MDVRKEHPYKLGFCKQRPELDDVVSSTGDRKFYLVTYHDDWTAIVQVGLLGNSDNGTPPRIMSAEWWWCPEYCRNKLKALLRSTLANTEKSERTWGFIREQRRIRRRA